MMLDRRQFLRPIAHRGLHDGATRVENTAPAFSAAIEHGYGIECDLQPASDGTPFVFHDATLDRLIDASGPIKGRTPGELAELKYRGRDTRLLSYADLLALVGGSVPMLVEVKSDWSPPDARFLKAIAQLSIGYRGPLALMSFDPAVMASIRELAPDVPRGIVSGDYEGHRWDSDKIQPERAFALRHLLESGAAAPSFYAYAVDDLPTPVTRFAREVMGVPLFTWTVRTPEQRRRAAQWADAPIFETFAP
jgi:glycerophosphoryl diester phosphodiesterase